MGQYQQWLHYREVDLQLKEQVETLEKELALLQERFQLLEQNRQEAQTPPPQVRNTLLEALALFFQQAQSAGKTEIVPLPTLQEQEAGRSAETMSSALFAWSNLPNFASQEPAGDTKIPSPEPVNASPHLSNLDTQLPPLPHSELGLLPDDLNTFIDQHALTDPQIELPWWFRNITASATNPYAPVDPESVRTNRLVQRWLERWGRQQASSNGNNQGDTHNNKNGWGG